MRAATSEVLNYVCAASVALLSLSLRGRLHRVIEGLLTATRATTAVVAAQETTTSGSIFAGWCEDENTAVSRDRNPKVSRYNLLAVVGCTWAPVFRRAPIFMHT